MNDLNSCLLSGTVTSITDTKNYTDFELEVTRFEHNAEGILIEVISKVPCRILGTLRETFNKFTEPGNRVRIVGHLAGVDKMVLVCEHIEWYFGKKKK